LKHPKTEAFRLCNTGRLLEAENLLTECDKDDPSVMLLLAQVRSARGRWLESLEAIDRFEMCHAGTLDSLLIKAACLRELDRFTEARLVFDEANDQYPDDVTVLSNRAALKVLMGELDDAEVDLINALRLRPDFPDACFHLAGIYLQRGEFEKGWRLYESRLKTKLAPKFCRFYPDDLRWQGSDMSLSGKKLLIYSEQGLGDVIQFSRFIPELLAMGCELICQVPKSLHRLFAKTWPSLTLFDIRGLYPGPFDYHCSLMSVPYLTGVVQPPKCHWLDLGMRDAELTCSKKPRVGLVWAGKANRDLERYTLTRRSMGLEMLAPLHNDGISFLSLQSEVNDTDRELMHQFGIEDLSGALTDFCETSRLMKTLDLVISIDTSVIHLAGAAGVPAWVLLPKVSDYRWSGSRMGSVWYPDIKIFRQDKPGDWSAPIAEVGHCLKQLFRLG
jgi:tetratricopeptide (TPR) repeat protein